jgi:putative ABC transport system permease protein
MRFLPLVWAALRRKPVRSTLVFLSVTVAFTLFGLMIGLNATLELVLARAHADRVWVGTRFDNAAFPIAVGKRVAALPGVKNSTIMNYLPGYIGDPKNRVYVVLVDDQYGRIYSDWGIRPEQWALVRSQRNAVVMSRKQAALLHKKVGDFFTVVSPETSRDDGTKNWRFQIVTLGEDISQAPAGYIFGNYDFYDKSRPLAEQGKISEVDFVAASPARATALAEQIDRMFANSSNPTYSQTETTGFAISNNFGGMDVEAVTRDVTLAGLLMILFLTATVIAQSVRERLAEFATLKSFGYSDLLVIGLVAVEAALPCLLGAGLGVTVAAWLAQQLPSLMPPTFGIPLPTMAPSVFLWAEASACLLALGSTVLPALKLRRLDVASALSGRA